MSRDANQGNPSDDTGMTDEEKQLREELGDTSQQDEMMSDESY